MREEDCIETKLQWIFTTLLVNIIALRPSYEGVSELQIRGGIDDNS